MKQSETVTRASLIKGVFNPLDAREILFTLFTNKINFHSLQSFSLAERTGIKQSGHEIRIKELKADKEALMAFLSLAEKQMMDVQIKGEITIELVDPSEKKS